MTDRGPNPTINRSVLLEFLRAIGLDSSVVTYVGIEPDRVAVEMFDLDEAGNTRVGDTGTDVATKKIVMEVLPDA